MIKINQQIPDHEFEIYHDNKIKKVKLSDYKGKWLVLVFYPGDFTFVCPTELEEISELYPEFQKSDCEIISVSTDTVFSHKAWHDTSPAIKKVQYPMAADPTGKICKDFNTYIQIEEENSDGVKTHLKDEGQSLRGTFLIDPDGVLKTMEIHDNDIGRSAKELLRKLHAAKFVREHTGQVCPAKWTLGKETLTPGVDLVGKI